MNNILRQAQQMQRKLAQAQEALADEEVTGSAGGGTVTVVASGTGQVRSVTIDPAALDPDDVELVQDMVLAAVNDALRAAKALEEERVGSVAGGMGLPPGLL